MSAELDMEVYGVAMGRVILLVDMNAFFISCEASRNPNIVGKPAAVAGDPKQRSGIVLAANYEARRCGVKTTMVIHEAKKLCPGIILLPPDHAFYEERSQEVMDLLSSFTPIVEQNSIDEAWLDMTGCETISGKPLEVSEKIMSRIKNELGLWCSIGISENKFLAKMASEMKKPLGITELWVKDVPVKLWPLPVTHMYGVGKSTAEKLKSAGILTIENLAKADSQKIRTLLGKSGEHLRELANGVDFDPVCPHDKGSMKSIGRSTTLSEDVRSLEEAKLVIMALSEEIGISARKNNKVGKTIQITIKYSDFKTITRQMSIPGSNLTKDILESSFALLEKIWDSNNPVRLLGVCLTGFDENESSQLSFFDSIEAPKSNEKETRLETAMDAIRNKHGINSLRRAALVQKKR